MNVTVTEPTTAGYITVYPHGKVQPTASNLNFVAFAYYTPFGIDGQAFALFGIVLPAAEAAIALAIILNFYNNHMTVDVDRANELKQ